MRSIEFLFSLPSAQLINHIVIFFLPTTQLPPDYAATVYFQWPGKQFQLLGGLSMEKQSAIFRLKGTAMITTGMVGGGGADDMLDDSMNAGGPASAGTDVTAQLGISVEPIAQVQQKLMALPAHLSSLTSSNTISGALVPSSGAAVARAGDNTRTLTLARRIIKNAFN